MQHSCSHYNAICNHSFRKRIELHHRNNHLLQNTYKEPIASGTTAAASVAHTRYLSSSPAATLATLHGKTQGFVLRLPPQNIDHATFMQPLQCDLQPQLQETHRTTPQEQPLVAKHIEGTNRVRNDRSRNRPSSLPFFTTSLRHHFPSPPLPFLTTSLRHHSPSSSLPFFTHPVS